MLLSLFCSKNDSYWDWWVSLLFVEVYFDLISYFYRSLTDINSVILN